MTDGIVALNYLIKRGAIILYLLKKICASIYYNIMIIADSMLKAFASFTKNLFS